jgi:alpha-L-rhamnosidase
MLRLLALLFSLTTATCFAGNLTPTMLRCEYLDNPIGMDELQPRLSWQVQSDQRGQSQSAYQILVASSPDNLAAGKADLWDSGKVASDETLHIVYAGEPLKSRLQCFWKVQSWDARDNPSGWSDVALWTMGLLDDSEWSAKYISYRDESEIQTDTSTLFLPPARQYRKEFTATKQVRRATIYATALGIYELHLNGQRVGDAYFSPGWTDYRQRAYYNSFDVTDLVSTGENAIGAWVADGWYSGYVGFGLLTGMGTEKCGRSNYGKTPTVMAQLEIEYTDGSRATIGTDKSWKVTGEGPIREADLLMGESYDARREMSGWSIAGFDDANWQPAILAEENGDTVADFYQVRNPTQPGRGVKMASEPRSLGFHRPKLEAFPGVPVRITEELPAKTVTVLKPGTVIFDLGQNFAGVIRLKVKGPAGHKMRIRYGEMLHPDGTLMTENLRKARATDFYVCRGDDDGEVFQPRFTFHGFQFVEVENFPGEAAADAVTGLVMHSDTPMTSEFECNDPMVNRLFQNVLWTQRANFLDLPTDCPQRDERMGWTGDAQAYVGTAAYNADIGAFYTKWLRELMESQRPSGAFPGYAPFPFQHGWDFGTAWADAGVICPWTIWQAYGDTRVIETCWEPMTRFMQWRKKTSVDDLGITHGNKWGDWLAQGAETPLDYVDTVYFAISAKMMSEMAVAIGRDDEAKQYRQQFERTRDAFNKKYVEADGRVNVRTQSAQALALFADLIPAQQREGTGRYLAQMIAENGNRMSTGFLGTRPLLPVLSDSGQHNLATFLLQSQDFPSWGYEISNGATTIWERWDSYTKEDAFGRHNAAMNSFSHYAFGAVCEWMFQTLAGISSDGPGYKKIIIRPRPPQSGSNAMREPINQVRATYDSIRGTIISDWQLAGGEFRLNVTIPANTTARVYIPTADAARITESGKPLADNALIRQAKTEDGHIVLRVGSGSYSFAAPSNLGTAEQKLETSEPLDVSMNPDQIDMSGARQLIGWDFTNPAVLKRWSGRDNVEVVSETGTTTLKAIGEDPKLWLTMDHGVSGSMVIEVKAQPLTDNAVEFYWAAPAGGFNPTQSTSRPIKASKQVNTYLFKLNESGTIGQLRFDPFTTLDQGSKTKGMRIESISIYALPTNEPSPNDQSSVLPPVNVNTAGMPNIVFFLSEDQGAQLSLLGTPGLQTPNIDALARSGVYFNNGFVAYPVCSASKAAMYTGLHNHTNGILNNTHNFHKPASKVTSAERGQRLAQTNRVKNQFLTLTELLRANGYYQGVTHKLHVLPNEKFPYDEFLHGSPQEIETFLANAKKKATMVPNGQHPVLAPPLS